MSPKNNEFLGLEKDLVEYGTCWGKSTRLTRIPEEIWIGGSLHKVQPSFMTENRPIVSLILRGSIAAGMVLLLMTLGAFEKLEGWGFNAQLAFRGPIAPQSPIVIISIDEDSFDELQFQWPWPRSFHGQLLHVLQESKPAIIGFDLLFTEPSLLGPDDDQVLSQRIRQAGNVVLGAALSQVDRAMYKKEDFNPPLPLLRRHAVGFGPVNLPVDNDAFVRQAQPIFFFQKKAFPSFDAIIFQKAKEVGITNAELPNGPFYINFRGGPQTFLTVPYYRVVNGEISLDVFHQKIVLIGATSPVLHDVYATPFAPGGTMPGVELHANVLETMLQGIPIHRIHRLVLAFLIFAIGMLGIGVANHWSPLAGLLVMAVIIVALLLGCYIGLTFFHMWTDLVPLPVTLVLSFTMTTIENYLKERREKQRLSQYFSPLVLQDILRHPAQERLHSHRRIVTVLFSDIRNFSAIAERLSPEETAAFLRMYFTEMTEAIFAHGGMVDKYMGDAIMALYNVPFDQPDHAGQAIRSALDCQQRLENLRRKLPWVQDSTLKCGIGIHTGEAIVGTMGSAQRFEYTAVGETINLGARLESVTKEFSTPIIFSETTNVLVKDQFPTTHLGKVLIKGKENAINIYTLRSLL